MNFSDEIQLQTFLEEYQIPVHLWGKDQAKTVGHLLRELQTDNVSLLARKNDLYRIMFAVSVSVRYRADDGQLYRLIEVEQKLSSGQVRIRNLEIEEKIRRGETHYEAALRALREELGFNDATKFVIEIMCPSAFTETKQSVSFPGLTTLYNRYNYTCNIDRTLYTPEGYIVTEPDKTNTFRWFLVK